MIIYTHLLLLIYTAALIHPPTHALLLYNSLPWTLNLETFKVQGRLLRGVHEWVDVLHTHTHLFLDFHSIFLCSTLPVVDIIWCIRLNNWSLCLCIVCWRTSSSYVQWSRNWVILLEIAKIVLYKLTMCFRRFCLMCINSRGFPVSKEDLMLWSFKSTQST